MLFEGNNHEELSEWSSYRLWADELLHENEDEKKRAKWIFRGVPDSDYPTQTSIERMAARLGNDPQKNLSKLPRIEADLFREFRRRAHLYLDKLPDEADSIQWLALMQHFGAPTRLLDWTYSPYVAAYFALEKWKRKTGKRGPKIGKVLAFNYRDSSAHVSKGSILGKDGEARIKEEMLRLCENRSIPDAELGLKVRQGAIVNCLLRDSYDESIRNKPGIIAVTPFQMNERLSIQQGLFLFPCDIQSSFMDNMRSVEGFGDKWQERSFRADPELIVRGLRDLYRMNISRTTLFPGLVGFAESMGIRALFEEIRPPEMGQGLNIPCRKIKAVQ